MATTYFSPGVYVEEKTSNSAPIAGVGTSTAGFIGVIDPSRYRIVNNVAVNIAKAPETAKNTKLELPVQLTNLKPDEELKGIDSGELKIGNTKANPAFSIEGGKIYVTFSEDVAADAKITGSLNVRVGSSPSTYYLEAVNETVGTGDGSSQSFPLKRYPVASTGVKLKVGTAEKSDGFSINNNRASKTATVDFLTAPEEKAIVIDYFLESVPENEVKLCTNFTEFKNYFGDFSTNPGQSRLAHAVYGFFRNGGTRCYVVWVSGQDLVTKALEKFEAIDEIAIVAAPGITDKSTLEAINTHCQNAGDRFAIFDTPEIVDDLAALKPGGDLLPGNTNYAALYFPWIKVFDFATKTEQFVAPSGHIAGIYARVDTQRGVHKAPANEPILGAVGLKYDLTKAKQDGLNPKGINCIRNLNGNIRVWGARTLGGDDNLEFKYINVRRLLLFLRESIDEGTQWSVFEPNSPDLWAKIRRNVTAFLMIVWRSGALFGSTPEQAFYVKCDEETNPPEIREAGQVVTEIGVAIVKPAEFVIFRLSQWAGPGGS